MRKTKKFLVAFLLTLLCVTIFALVGCSSQGKRGEKGQDGLNGKSAYEIWIDNGHSGSESDFLEWLKGKDGTNGKDGQNGLKGDTGETGSAGPQGPQGEKGETGLTGPQGEKGDKGETGGTGPQGEKGNDGQNGTNGTNGLSAYEIFLKYNPDYTGTEEQWINGLVNNQLIRYTITFKSEVHEDIIKTAFYGLPLLDIPEVPEKEGQESATWDRTDFSRITEDLTVTAIYTMKQFTVTFHNEFTDDEDIIKTVTYGEAITDIPTVTEKVGNDGYWDIKDFSRITSNLTVNAVYATQGLQYTLINQQTEYSVSKGNLSGETKELFIPKEYEGKLITVIADKGFNECTNLNFVKIPNTIIKIGNSAFISCSLLKKIEIPSSVSIIGYNAFYNCFSLVDVKIPNGISILRYNTFNGCHSLISIAIPDSVMDIEWGVFQGCISLTSISLPNKITTLPAGVFAQCTSLVNIVIPSSITSISNGAFHECTNLESVYYMGNQSNLGKVEIGEDNNNYFIEATVYYFSETAPTDDGNYWHYDIDEITPIVWSKKQPMREQYD